MSEQDGPTPPWRRVERAAIRFALTTLFGMWGAEFLLIVFRRFPDPPNAWWELQNGLAHSLVFGAVVIVFAAAMRDSKGARSISPLLIGIVAAASGAALVSIEYHAGGLAAGVSVFGFLVAGLALFAAWFVEVRVAPVWARLLVVPVALAMLIGGIQIAGLGIDPERGELTEEEKEKHGVYRFDPDEAGEPVTF